MRAPRDSNLLSRTDYNGTRIADPVTKLTRSPNMKIELDGLRHLQRPTLEKICTDCARLVGPQGKPVEDVLATVSGFRFMKDERFDDDFGQTVGSRARAGKTIPARGPGGVTSTVIIPERTLGFSVVLCDGRSQDELPELERSIISHEIGHAWDCFVRDVVLPDDMTEKALLATPFRIDATAKYFSQRLGFELAACANSARAFSAKLLSECNARVWTWTVESRKRIDREFADLRSGKVDTHRASHFVNAELWDVLTEWAKTLATVAANDPLADGCEHPWVGTRWENTLRQHLEVVRSLVRRYPEWPDDAMVPIQDVWRTFGAEIFNCRFVDGDSEDRVVRD